MSASDSGGRHDPRSSLRVKPSWEVREDLHLHTTASDGTMTPTEVVELVSTTSLRLFSITDHDTTMGLDEAEAASQAHPNITFIPGIELSSAVDDSEIHLTCHFIDRKNAALQRELAALFEDRATKAEQIVDRLNEIGVRISWDDIAENAQGAIGRPHIARAMIAAGYVENVPEAFDRYLSPGRPGYISRRKLDGVHALELVADAGGVATVAHPRTVSGIGHVLSVLAPHGLAGIEVYAEKYGYDLIDRYSAFADRFGLVKSGGTDYHANHTRNEIIPGMNGPPPGTVRELYRRAKDAHGDRVGYVLDESKL